MLHRPGPEAFAAAEQAVQYARMVGARDIELHARLTLGGLLVDAGEHEAGLTQMRQVLTDTLAEGVPHVADRAYVNLPSELMSVGRDREAVPLLREGIAFARRHGLPDSEAWMWGNLSDALYSLGQWPAAAEAATQAIRAGHGAKPGGAGALKLAQLALARGDLAEAARQLSAARARYGTDDPMPQQSLPLARVALATAAAQGRIADARAELLRALDTGLPPGTHRYGWPLLLAAATAEAGATPAGELAVEADELEQEYARARQAASGLHAAHEELRRAEQERERRLAERQQAAVRAASRLTRREALDREQTQLEAELAQARGTADSVATRAAQ
ncbi:hypothetical protein ACFY7X_36050, partial [Streptomyces althioticus]